MNENELHNRSENFYYNYIRRLFTQDENHKRLSYIQQGKQTNEAKIITGN